jgi:dihydropteroate synthase
MSERTEKEPKLPHLMTRHGLIKIHQRTAVMGVVNVTPDSFYDGGRRSPEEAIAHGAGMAAEGADIIDIGGESTRPGAAPVSEQEEIHRVVPVIRGLRRLSRTPISIDTSKSAVARAALAEGADIINDVSALRFDPAMAAAAADGKVPVILMHMQGTPRTMQLNPSYRDVVAEVREFLAERVRYAIDNGIDPERIVVDPGIGFGKTLRHNLLLLNGVSELASLGYPVLVGASRKAFIGKLLNGAADDRLEGSLAVAVAAVLRGANIIRAHDVKETRRAVDIADAIQHAAEQSEIVPHG